MNYTDPILFYKDFKKQVNEKRIDEQSGKTYLDIYRKNKDFTRLITNDIEKIIKQSLDNIETSREYYRIDVTGWISRYNDMKKDADEFGVKINAHFWDLIIAVEHENSLTDWSDEIIKLAHIKCPLKVLISYNNYDRRDEDLAKIFFVTKWLKKVEAFSVGDENYLIILGNAYNSKTKKSDYSEFDYRGYIYNKEISNFESITTV